MPTKRLSDQHLRNIQPQKKRYELFDQHVKGLGIRVSPGGSKTFFISYHSPIDDNSRRFTLGKFPALSLSEARKQAKRLFIDIAQGNDPGKEKRKREQAEKQKIDFNLLADQFLLEHVVHLKPNTQKVYKSIIERHIKQALGKIEVQDFTRQDARRYLKTFADKDQPVHGNRVHANLSKMLNFAVDEGYIKANPMNGLPKLGKESSRERAYSNIEIKKLWEGFESEYSVTNAFLKMLMLLAQRRGETAHMKWSDIDLNKKLWTIPATDTKNNMEHTVPLNDVSIGLIGQLKPITGSQTYVFNSLYKDNTPINSFTKLANRIKKRSGIEDFRIHDLRRTVATQLAKDGVPQEVLKKILNHTTGMKQDITSVYNRYDYLEEKRTALNNWERILKQIISGENQDCTIRSIKTG